THLGDDNITDACQEPMAEENAHVATGEIGIADLDSLERKKVVQNTVEVGTQTVVHNQSYATYWSSVTEKTLAEKS
nr:hypothetical protein [Tanacetum cinerariifolium]